MTKMIEIIEEMRTRLNQITETEHTLVRALAEALRSVDQKLLQDVRNITTEHEARRGVILSELQGLASRIGAFPLPPREQAPGLEFAEAAPAAVPQAKPALNGHPRPFSRGDWRQAASNMQSANNVEDELDIYFKDRIAAH